MAVKVAIVGRPNVGKSTLFNRLVGKRLALVDDRPGVTRDRRYAEGQLGDLALTLIDTAGYEDVTDESLEARMRAQTEAAIEDADLILFMVDAREGVTPLDRIFADRLRRIETPVVVLANKSESRESGGGVGEAHSLGFGEPVAISAEHGEGMADLYAAVVAAIGDMEAEAAEEADKPIRIAVIGRPNAGKSTLINRLLGEDRLLTGPEAGITRDSISVDWTWEGRAIRLVDTAGLRRKARVQEKLEKLSVADTLRAITFAEVVILVMDRDNAFDTQDLQLADLVEREGRALVYAIAKWDLEDEPQARLTALKAEAERTLPQLKGAPFVALSAFSGRGVERLMPAVIQAHDTWSAKVKTRDLNDWLALAVQRHPPPAVDGKRVKPKYVAQTKARPPTFVMFASRAAAMPDHYKRYLVNGIRESFDLWGTPIRLTVKAGANPYAEGGEKAGLVRARAARPVYPVAKKVKAPKEEKAPGLPGKALQAQNAARAEAAAKPKPAPKVRVKPLAGLKASASKKAGTSAVLGKRARGGARQVSRSGRVRTGAPKGKR